MDLIRAMDEQRANNSKGVLWAIVVVIAPIVAALVFTFWVMFITDAGGAGCPGVHGM